jgi:hypothetical protein
MIFKNVITKTAGITCHSSMWYVVHTWYDDRRLHEEVNAGCSGVVAKQGDWVRIPSELLNVLLDPLQSGDLLIFFVCVRNLKVCLHETRSKWSWNRILCHKAKLCRMTQLEAVLHNCVVGPNFVSSNQILCCPNEFYVVRMTFVSSEWFLCHPNEFCVIRMNFVSSEWILCRPNEFCVIRPNFVSSKWILCT